MAGGKSGAGEARTPVEAPDTLHSVAFARVLDAVSEGEIVGLVDGLKSIYLNETPLQNADDTYNFKNVQVDSRTGTQDQEPLPGFPEVESETGVGVPLDSDTPWVHAFTNLSLTDLRIRLSVDGLKQVDPETGDTNGYEIEYTIELATDGGAYDLLFDGSFKGKASSTFERSHTISLPAASGTGWLLRVTRITPEANSQYVADTMNVVSYTEMIQANLRYPHTALVGIVIDASQFKSVPNRAYHLKGRIIRVPSNYNAETRAYTGDWDGTFQLAYSNNPAWVYYDMATHPVYGLGHLVSDAMMDKWALYSIAQYCDGLVDDGKGGTEPRFTCNIYLQRQADAYKVMQDLASVFRGMSYWAAGQIISVADQPADPIYTYTNANVAGGTFEYSGTSRRARHTVALVQWTDMQDFGRGKIEYVSNDSAIARYGVQQLNITAIAATSQGMAHRMGKWALLSEELETNTVGFEVGLDGVIPLPGKIIRIADEHRAGSRIGGRVRAATTSVITPDAMPSAEIGNTLTVILPSSVAESRPISAVGASTITVSPAFSAAPVKGAAWVVESAELEAQHFRVLGVDDTNPTSYKIMALQKNESKFSAVEAGLVVQVPNTALIPSKVIAAPASVTITQYEKISSALPVVVLVADCDPVLGAIAYEFAWRLNLGDWSPPQRMLTSRFELENAAKGEYLVRVRAIGYSGVQSQVTTSDATIISDASYRDEVAILPVVGVATLDFSKSEQFYLVLTEDVTLQFANPSAESGAILRVHNTGAWGLTLPGTVTAEAPAVAYTATLGGDDKLGFTTLDGGASYTLRYDKGI
jgi:predicted phage tail protein